MEGSGCVQIITDRNRETLYLTDLERCNREKLNCVVFGSATWRRGTLALWSRCSCYGIPSWRPQCKQTMLSSCGRYNKIICSIPLFRISTYSVNPEPIRIWIQTKIFYDKIKNILLLEHFFDQKPLQRTFVQALQTRNFFIFFLFWGTILACLDPDPYSQSGHGSWSAGLV